ncbi:hypothetical protein C8F04DRAFT_1192353 [Mycena alexandri]|uniref:Uncharacterized protein n=1 Tax=Mycena alexandri TaxID=1745969 RepID=A0AAD6SC63_9AGAR|nr:hypothetical protein C8F04DRAFT_1192353 [Mycena alexandri]
MAKLLAGLELNVDFKLGRQRPVGNGNTVHHYVLSNNEEPAEFLIIGTLSSVIDRPGEPKVLILNAPEGHFPIIQSVFRKQDTFDLSNKPEHPLKIIAPEVTVDPFSIAPVPKGSLLMSSVIPFRVDMPAKGAPTVHSRYNGSQRVQHQWITILVSVRPHRTDGQSRHVGGKRKEEGHRRRVTDIMGSVDAAKRESPSANSVRR